MSEPVFHHAYEMARGSPRRVGGTSSAPLCGGRGLVFFASLGLSQILLGKPSVLVKTRIIQVLKR